MSVATSVKQDTLFGSDKSIFDVIDKETPSIMVLRDYKNIGVDSRGFEMNDLMLASSTRRTVFIMEYLESYPTDYRWHFVISPQYKVYGSYMFAWLDGKWQPYYKVEDYRNELSDRVVLNNFTLEWGEIADFTKDIELVAVFFALALNTRTEIDIEFRYDELLGKYTGVDVYFRPCSNESSSLTLCQGVKLLIADKKFRFWRLFNKLNFSLEVN